MTRQEVMDSDMIVSRRIVRVIGQVISGDVSSGVVAAERVFPNLKAHAELLILLTKEPIAHLYSCIDNILTETPEIFGYIKHDYNSLFHCLKRLNNIYQYLPLFHLIKHIKPSRANQDS